jgi:hypothetical protein
MPMTSAPVRSFQLQGVKITARKKATIHEANGLDVLVSGLGRQVQTGLNRRVQICLPLYGTLS